LGKEVAFSVRLKEQRYLELEVGYLSESRRLFQPKVTPESESRPLRVLRGKWGSSSRSLSKWRPPADTSLHLFTISIHFTSYRGADKSLARAGRKQATATEDSEFHISYL